MRFKAASRPSYYSWRKWFAWYPVRIQGEMCWLEWVDRQPYTCVDGVTFGHDYRLPR